MHERPIWEDAAQRPSFPALDRDLDVDVAVVGAGITGLTTAWLLAQAGYRVAVLEAATVASGTTGHSSAHLTVAMDEGYRSLESAFGEDGCRHVLDANTEAIDLIERTCRELGVPGFQRVDAWHYSEARRGAAKLGEEEEVLRRLGARAEAAVRAPLPFANQGGYRLEQQAVFQPVAYCVALARAILAAGGHVFERSRVDDWSAGAPVHAHVGPHRVTAAFLVLATHTPIGRVLSVQARVMPMLSYLMVYELEQPLPVALFFDDAEPYHYIRPFDPTRPELAVVGGADHHTAQPRHHEEHFRRLDAYARERLPIRREVRRWSHELFEPADGLPYVGALPLTPNVLAATGFSGQGLTLGTAAARVLTDVIRGEPTRYGGVFDLSRLKPVASARKLLELNFEVLYHFVVDRLRSVGARALSTLQPGDGTVVRVRGRRAAVYREPSGRLLVLSPVCTHMGCHVAWNDTEKSWDCPCHGGRFHPDGRVMFGPPLSPLPVRAVEEGDLLETPASRAEPATRDEQERPDDQPPA